MNTKFIQLISFTTGSELHYNIAHIDISKLQYNGRYTSIPFDYGEKGITETLVKETPEQIIKLIEEKK